MTNKYNQALRYEIFEKEEYVCAKEVIQQATIIFDIGGHIGFFSERCRMFNKETEIHYFEPLPFLYQEAKVRLNKEKNLILNTVWIGVEEGNIPFLVNKEKTMQSSKYSSFLNPIGEAVNVNMITLESYLKKNTIPFIDLVKMDIEGMEFEVLESWSTEVWKKIWSLVIEVHLFNEEMQKRYQKLKVLFHQNFSTVEEEVSEYTDTIRLVFCKK